MIYKKYKIAKYLMDVIEKERQEYLKWWSGCSYRSTMNDHCGEDYKLKRPSVYMLAGRKNEINKLITLSTEKEGSCGIMGYIHPNTICLGLHLIPEKSRFMGFARVGAFHTATTTAAGYGKDDMHKSNKDCILLSAGRNDVVLERPISKYEDIQKLTLSIIGEENVQDSKAVDVCTGKSS